MLPNTQHHALRKDVEALDREKYPEPIYAVLRNPYEYVLSRYWHRQQVKFSNKLKVSKHPHCSLEEFIPDFARDVATLSIVETYQEYIDRYFLFSDGLRSFFTAVGFPHVDIPWIGKSPVTADNPQLKIEDLDSKYKDMIDESFPKEVELYERVLADIGSA